jgi:hypothetical protein
LLGRTDGITDAGTRLVLVAFAIRFAAPIADCRFELLDRLGLRRFVIV